MSDMKDEINILDYAKVLSKRRDLIALTTAVVFFLVSMYCLFTVPQYKAETTLLIPQQSGHAMESILALSTALTGSTVNMPTDMNAYSVGRSTNFTDILKSYTMAKMVVKGIALQKYYNMSDMDKLVKMVQKKIKVKETKGVLVITATDPDPRMSADLANYYVLALDDFNRRYNLQFTRRMSNNIQEQLASSKVDLSDAEEKLREFETRAQMVKMSERDMMLARLMRDVKVKEAVYTMLMQEYEKTRIEEAKEELFFEVLDPAREPAHPFNPKPILYSVVAVILGAIMGSFLAFLFEYLEGVGVKFDIPDIRKEMEWRKT
jgi:tyrosine-protein kinase Etk/Wzc